MSDAMSDEKMRRVIWCATCGVALVFEWSRPTAFPNAFQAAMARLIDIHNRLDGAGWSTPRCCTGLECKMSVMTRAERNEVLANGDKR